MRWRVDGRLYQFTLRAAWADDFAGRLVEDFARGWHFDADARQFTDPSTTDHQDSGEEDAGVSFYDLVVDHTARLHVVSYTFASTCAPHGP